MRTGSTFSKILNAISTVINPATEETLSTRTKPSDQQHTIIDTAIPTGANTIGAVEMKYYDMGTLAQTTVTGADGAIHSMNYETGIALGHSANHQSFRGFGERSAATNVVTGNDVWQGTATSQPIPPTAGDLMSVVSTSALDGVAGTGVLTLDIHYIDPAGNFYETIITMNGTTIVNTGIAMRFIQAIHAETVGSNGSTVGTITIFKTGTPTTVYNQLAPGGNMSLTSSRMIPLGKTFYMTNLSVTAADNTSVSVRLRSTSTFEDVLTTGLFFLFKDVSVLQNGSREKTFRVPLKFPALCIIKFTAYSITNGATIAVNYDGWTE